MLEKNYNNVISFIFIIGVALRVTLYISSPPNNSYDDHLEVIKIYSETFGSPGAFDCWECYQPPVYYYFSSIVLRFSDVIGVNDYGQWKMVQIINPLLSILMFVSFVLIFKELKVKKKSRLVLLSLLAVLPRDLYTSAMIGNDYLISFLCVLALLLFIKSVKFLYSDNTLQFKINYALLSCIGLLSFFTKQHGLLVMIFPLSVGLIALYRKINVSYVFSILILNLSILGFELYNNVIETDQLMVSNQHHFDYAHKQPPGDVGQVEFLSFRFYSLLKEPFISESTLQSLPTELFARIFFDYEWRYISPKIKGSYYIGLMSYLWGAFWMGLIFYWVVSNFKIPKSNSKVMIYLCSLVLIGLFIMVPFIQTIRFPYFSSMKAMFILPGLIMGILIVAKMIPNLNNKYAILLILGNLLFGFAYIGFIAINIDNSLPDLHGPLWTYP